MTFILTIKHLINGNSGCSVLAGLGFLEEWGGWGLLVVAVLRTAAAAAGSAVAAAAFLRALAEEEALLTIRDQ